MRISRVEKVSRSARREGSRMQKQRVLVLAVIAAALAMCPPARADVAVEGGIVAAQSKTTLGGGLGLGLFKAPVVPLSAELHVTGGNGYAATLDARFSPGGTTIGAGIGGGSIGRPGTARALYDVILGQSLVPHIALEGRVYFGAKATPAAFAGVRFSL